MNLNIKNIITLEDNNEYIVTSIAYYEGFEYVYLVDINKPENIKFCKIINSNGLVCLEEVTDDKTIAKIAPILYTAIAEEIKS